MSIMLNIENQTVNFRHFVLLSTKINVVYYNFLLTDTNKSISEIARELGFSDNHNFSRTYKKLTGLSPSEYRNTFSKRLLYHV